MNFDADTIRNKLRELVGDMPLARMLRGEESLPTVNSLRERLQAMPVFDQQSGAQGAYDAAMNIGPMGLGKIVYHGSPHKFDKFDASKIGTGEGAQAYGHGVYLADSKGVANDYANKLSDPDAYVTAASPKWAALAEDANKMRPPKAVPADFERQLKSYAADENYYPAKKVLAGLRSGRLKMDDGGGALYKADLPDEWIPKMLDWDNSIPEEMRQAISKPMMEKFGSGASGGQGLNQWKQVVWEFKNAGSKQPEVDAANFLREQGVTGIRYLDGGSRGAGQGSYNYVVFPGLEDQVKILERNGQPVNALAEMLK